jgi:hypothetical protein
VLTLSAASWTALYGLLHRNSEFRVGSRAVVEARSAGFSSTSVSRPYEGRSRRPKTCTLPDLSRCSKLSSLYSMTSSARASTAGGIVRPRALAVLRLITKSYLVGACTGMSAGFSPLRMRST